MQYQNSKSLWSNTAVRTREYSALSGEVTTDLCVIGGGFTGLSTAIHAAEGGLDVAVLEAREPGWGASGRNGGQVIPGLKYDPEELIARFGPTVGERLVECAGNAPKLLFDLVRKYEMDCDAIHSGWLQPSHADVGNQTIRRRADQWQRYGVDVRILGKSDTAELLGSNHYTMASLDPRGGSIQPLSYARELARVASTLGAHVFGDSPALDMSRDGDAYIVSTANGKVRTGSIVFATNAYTDTIWPGLSKTVIPVHSFQVATAPLPSHVVETIFPQDHCASDTRRLLWYFRKDRTGRLLMGGRGFPIEHPRKTDTQVLQQALREVYPQIGDIEFEYHWGGQVGMTADHLPHLHQLDRNIFAGLGFNGRGVAMGTTMGKVLAQAVLAGSAENLPFPASPIRRIPFHAFNRIAVNILAARYRRLDRKDRTASAGSAK